MNYGKKIEFEDMTYYQPGEGEQGLCYKDELSFYNGDVCYIPEAAFKRATPVKHNGEYFYPANDLAPQYTRKVIEAVTENTEFTAEDVFAAAEGMFVSSILLAASDSGQIGVV